MEIRLLSSTDCTFRNNNIKLLTRKLQSNILNTANQDATAAKQTTAKQTSGKQITAKQTKQTTTKRTTTNRPQKKPQQNNAQKLWL